MKPNIAQILQHLNSIANKIKNEIPFESLTVLNSSITDIYNFDSLEFMEFISAVEKEFDMEFDDSATYEELNNLNYLLQVIIKKSNTINSEKTNYSNFGDK